MHRFFLFGTVCLLALAMTFSYAPCSHARPPKPGPHFVWIEPHVTSSGAQVPGHWQYTGTAQAGKRWAPGHRNANGTWVPGHWQAAGVPPKGKNWVPGHYNRQAKWIPGHWR